MLRKYNRHYKGCVTDDNNTPIWQHYSVQGKKDSDDIHKLHISIDPDDFNLAEEKLYPLLDKALDSRLIFNYKVYNVHGNMIKNAGEKLILRQRNNPFVIYLPDNPSENKVIKIVKLCIEIETLLINIKPGDEKKRAICDLPLTPHIIFRQAFLNGEYISVNSDGTEAYTQKLERLKLEAQRSNYYKLLKHLANFTLLYELKNEAISLYDQQIQILIKAYFYIQIFEEHIRHLQLERLRLAKYINENNIDPTQKTQIIDDKILSVKQAIIDAKDIIAFTVSEREYKNIEEESDYIKQQFADLKKLETCIQLSRAQQKLLYAHTTDKNTLKYNFMRLFNIPSTSQINMVSLIENTENEFRGESKPRKVFAK